MKKISFFGSLVLAAIFLVAGCGSSPDQGDKTDPAPSFDSGNIAQAGNKNGVAPSGPAAASSALTLDNLVGIWQATSFIDHASGEAVDLKGYDPTIAVTADGRLTLTIHTGNIYPIVYHATLSVEGENQLKADMFGKDAFDVVLSNDTMTWTAAPYAMAVPFKIASNFVDATWQRISTYVPPPFDLSFYETTGKRKETSSCVHNHVGPSEDVLKTHPEASVTVNIKINEYLKFVFDDGKGTQTPYLDHFSVKTGNWMTIDKLKEPFPIALSGDTLTFTAMKDIYGDTVDIVFEKTN